jgi:hypothetical protein
VRNLNGDVAFGLEQVDEQTCRVLVADHRLEKRSVSCRCIGSPQIFLQRRATCVRCRTSVEAAIDWLKAAGILRGGFVVQ